ncbi:serine/threonine-protein kinase [Acanthopleuribacter pedis]|uniref:non-specific serine/threonine protein kinase n=1 Tax=Acanthopleuribacter pedis TaxID=442870 RepID=A0A8J7Q7Y1_9BACT|nr:serine/threonine-protein kinase [Acanthopleuribacter pedis]MBO1319029.1 serine/threonine protein kinase [Acanthopleuribacter pedis]
MILLVVEKKPKFIESFRKHLALPDHEPLYVNRCADAAVLLQQGSVGFLLIDLDPGENLEQAVALLETAAAKRIPCLVLEHPKAADLVYQLRIHRDNGQFLKLPLKIPQVNAKMQQMKRGDDPMIGVKLGPVGQQVEIERRLGEGAMGTVYQGCDEALGRKVAVKFLNHQYLREDPDAARRFANEARAVARLRSNHIVQIFFTGTHEERPYSVMEWLQGPPLDSFLRQRGVLPVKEAVALAQQVLDGLDEAHRNQQIHRDVKPANIMLNTRGEAVLLDFGLVRGNSTQNLTQHGALLGTPRYMAPEQINGESIDGRIDLYAVGIILYEMVLGVAPFRGKDLVSVLMKHLNQPLPKPESLGRRLDPALFAILETFCAKDRDQRYPTALAAKEALTQYLARYQEPQGAETNVAPEFAAAELTPYSTAIFRDQRTQLGTQQTRDGALLDALPRLDALFQFFGEHHPELGAFEQGSLDHPGGSAALLAQSGGTAMVYSEAPKAGESLRHYHPDVLRALLKVGP